MARFICLASALMAFGCTTHETEPTLLTPASGTASPIARSIDRITMARCSREARCNNIGNGKKYDNREQCQREIRDSAYDSLGPTECTSGIDQAQLNECLAAIQGEECGNVIDTIERVAACRSSALCAE